MNVLEEADNLTANDRQEVYSHPADDFNKVVRMAQPILESDIDPKLKHALYMVQVKIARLLNTPDHRDSIVDICGYARTYEMILEKQREGRNDSNKVAGTKPEERQEDGVQQANG